MTVPMHDAGERNLRSCGNVRANRSI
jgi:hypothetical protein